MMQKKIRPAPGEIRIGAVPPGARPMAETPTAWPFSGMPLRSGADLPRGATGLGTITGWASLTIRTTDAVADAGALIGIAKKFSLTCGPLDAGSPGFVFKSQGDYLVAGVLFDSPAGSGNGNCYSITVVQPVTDTSTSAAKLLALKIARELFAMKEKPHFSDETAASFEKALSAIS